MFFVVEDGNQRVQDISDPTQGEKGNAGETVDKYKELKSQPNTNLEVSKQCQSLGRA